MAKYFKRCQTAEELKKEYRRLAKELHPDLGGKTEDFQKMQDEFESAWKRLKDIHVNREGEQYRKETDETAEAFMEIINTVINLTDVETEVCGAWVWCSGNTKEYKEIFKRLGFRWSRNKKAWYWHQDGYKRWHDREYSMEEIRDMYGSTRYKKRQEEKEKRLAMQP